MKKIFGMLFCVFIINLTFGQVLKLRSTSIAYKTQINDYQWSSWSSWESTNVLIVIYSDEDRIVIYSEKTQIYDAIKDEGKSFDSDGDETLSMLCLDNDGIRCRIRVVKLHSQNGKLQFYIDYADMKWVYNVCSID